MATVLVKGKPCSLWDLEVSECGRLDGKLFMVVTKNHGTSFIGIEYQDGETRTFDKVFPGVVYAGKGDLSWNLTFPEEDEGVPGKPIQIRLSKGAAKRLIGKRLCDIDHKPVNESCVECSEEVTLLFHDGSELSIYAITANGKVEIVVEED